MKKILFIMMATIIILSGSVSEAKEEKRDIKEDNYLIEQSLNNFFSKGFPEIQDNLGNNVTVFHKKKIEEFYNSRDFEGAKNYLLDNSISLAWYDGISTRASLAKNSSKTFYKLYKSTNYGSIKKEWVVRLSGTFYYDQNKRVVVSVGRPVLSIEVANFGSGFKPYLASVSTTGTKNGSYGAIFKASYTMKATMNIKQSGVTISGTVLFPRDTVSYSSSL
ncbi:MAG: hypothetical protein Q4E02_00115 [Lagierella massiliensis]|nr:hypothetical protein [Lagierella massiliensis]